MANDPMLEMFIFENAQLTERLEEILIEGEAQGGFNTEHINEIFRIMHTIKGSAAMMEYTQISTLAHKIEDMFFYIREHENVSPDWGGIADICLEAVDFFKREVGKIQAGMPSDGNSDSTQNRIKSCMSAMTGNTPAAAPQNAPSAAGTRSMPASSPAAGAPCFEGRIFFEDGCKMENIRAYQIVNLLAELSERIETVPADLLEDCADQIAAEGVGITIYSDKGLDTLLEAINGALFVKNFELHEAQSAPVEAVSAETISAEAVSAGAVPAAAQPPESKTAAAQPQGAPAEIKQNFISVNVEKLDKLMDLMGEIVISVAMVVGNSDLEGLVLDNFEKASSQLLKNTNELQNIIMSVRMIPISSTFHKMSRIVRDTSKKLGKDAELVILGEETEVDKNIIDNLSDPLMHIIRNSMDHGLEDSREARLAARKPAVGRIVLEARNSGSDVIIACSDDGRGLDRDKILAKAARNGLLTRPESEYSDKEVFQFIMLPGFSTNEQVTELSGRGVGMDVVKKNIERIGGTVVLDSTPGQGMTVSIRIPLTLAILQSIEISVGKNIYLIPTLNIREAFKPRKEDIIVDPDGNEMILFRGECFAIVRLHELFGVSTDTLEFENGIMIMIEDDGRMAAVFADRMVGEQQAVVKPIPAFITERIGQIHGISGCTLLGDGSISLIIDVKSLTQEGRS